MKHGLLWLLGIILLCLPGLSQAQCSNQVTISYYNNGTLTSQTVNNGQSGYSAAVCPVAGAQYAFDGSSTSNAVLTWARVISQGATAATDVVETLSSATATAGTVLTLTTSFTTTTTYRLQADADSYPKGNCKGSVYAYLTVSPALMLSASVSSICAGSAVTLTAAGSTSGTYTWAANGTTLSGQTGSTLVDRPTTTTTYTVTTTTSCGTSSQQLTVRVNDVVVTPSAPTICSGQSTTLTASYAGSGATYQWYVKGLPTVLASGATLTRSPLLTTTYQVVATTTDCGTLTKDVTVTVGSTPAPTVTPSAATICPGSSVTLSASSANPAATYSWSPATGLSTATGASVVASPTATTTYTVTATTPCGSTSSQVTVVVAAPAFSVNPASSAICAGSSTTLSANANNSNATYRWYNTANLGTILSTASSITVAPTTSTTYRVVSTNPCTTTVSSQDIPVTVNTPPSVTAKATEPTILQGALTTLSASGASDYTWSPSTGLSAITGSSVIASPLITTTYTVIGKSASGCISSGQVTLSVALPLPVSLIRFDAVRAAKGVLLSWTTASELNCDYFEVERSLDGSTFATIGRRAGAGTKATQTSYELLDTDGKQPAAGAAVYYRLRQVDVSGQAYYSTVRTVRAATEVGVLQATVFPNPYDKAPTVQLQPTSTEAVVLTLRNVLGQTLFTQTVLPRGGTQELELPAAAVLPAGVYFLTVRQGSQQQVVQLSHR